MKLAHLDFAIDFIFNANCRLIQLFLFDKDCLLYGYIFHFDKNNWFF